MNTNPRALEGIFLSKQTFQDEDRKNIRTHGVVGGGDCFMQPNPWPSLGGTISCEDKCINGERHNANGIDDVSWVFLSPSRKPR